jgi:hypothetical protein
MSEDEVFRDIYNDIMILSRELDLVNRKIELIEIVKHYSLYDNLYDEMCSQELYYYSTWKNIILESLERLQGLRYGSFD